MSNNPKNSKLSDQFGDFIEPTESDLINLGDSYDGGYYTPGRIEDMREGFSDIDANYTALRNSRARTRGAGTTDFGVTSAADRSAAAVADNPEWLGSELTGGSKNTGNTSDFDAADTHGKYRGAGLGGMDIEAGPRASSFDVHRPRNTDEAAARIQGEILLKVAGPTCNHPRCQAFRAKGMELWERSLGPDRRLNEKIIGKSTVPHLAIPSVRRDSSLAQMELRPESADVPEGQRKGSFGTGESTDMGDFIPNEKNRVVTPITKVMDKEHPQFKKLMNQYKTSTQLGDHDIFHPDDWLEHHHAPGEEFAPLPWES